MGKSPFFTVIWLLIGLGVACITYSAYMPAYTDDQEAEQVISGGPRPDWHERMSELRTQKWVLQDVGAGLTSLAVSLGIFFAFMNVRSWRSLLDLTSPRSEIFFIVWGSLAWLACWPAFLYVIFRDMTRGGFYPWWADTPAIPLMSSLVVPLSLPLPIIIGWFVLRGAPLPVSLDYWDSTRAGRSIFWSAVLGMISTIVLWVLFEAVVEGNPFSVPAAVIGLYLSLSARAAIVARGSNT